MLRKHKSQRGSKPAFMLGLSWLTGSSLKTNRAFVQTPVLPHSEQIRVYEPRETEICPVLMGHRWKQTHSCILAKRPSLFCRSFLSVKCWSDCETMTGPFETADHWQPHTLSSVNERHCLLLVWIRLLLSTLNYSGVDEQHIHNEIVFLHLGYKYGKYYFSGSDLRGCLVLRLPASDLCSHASDVVAAAPCFPCLSSCGVVSLFHEHIEDWLASMHFSLLLAPISLRRINIYDGFFLGANACIDLKVPFTRS